MFLSKYSTTADQQRTQATAPPIKFQLWHNPAIGVLCSISSVLTILEFNVDQVGPNVEHYST